jgi:hypothetical protein
VTNAERELLEQAWLGHLRAELTQREQFKAELLAEWQRRRAQLLDDLCKARVRGDLPRYRELRLRRDRYYTTVPGAEDEPPVA